MEEIEIKRDQGCTEVLSGLSEVERYSAVLDPKVGVFACQGDTQVAGTTM